jgi:hypothetical protein
MIHRRWLNGGPVVRISSGRVRGLAAPGVNLLNNMVYECYEQLTTRPLRKGHNVLQQPNLVNILAQTNPFRHKKGAKLH